jgi:protein-S-isoprenylcysteine O-methyltransferase Ste14
MRVLAVVAAVLAAALAALGVFAIWLPFSSDPPDTATGYMIGLGCFFLAVALMLAWIARRAWRF